MFRHRLTHRVAGILGISVLTLSALSAPVTAQIVRDHRGGGGGGGGVVVTPTGNGGGGTNAQPGANGRPIPLRVYFVDMLCEDESNDNTWPRPDHDEPYALVFAADLREATPKSWVSIAGAFSDVDTGESRTVNQQIWSPSGQGSPIESDNDYIFLVAMMEEDDESQGYNHSSMRVWRKVNETLPAKLTAYKQSGLSKAGIVSRLRTDMTQAIAAAKTDDDRVGDIFEIVWGPNGLNAARFGHAVDLFPRFVGSDSSYKLKFRLQ